MKNEFSHDTGIRASDADRDTAAQRLATALEEGRLDLGEYDNRLSSAMGATTLGDLVPLTADLPEAARPEAKPVDLAEVVPGTPDRSRWRDWFDEWRWWLGGAFVMTAIWGVSSLESGEPQNYWPLWPLAVWAAILVASALLPSSGKKKSCG